ncbi:hypothetical protein D3C73_1210500 [compost metagenome]
MNKGEAAPMMKDKTAKARNASLPTTPLRTHANPIAPKLRLIYVESLHLEPRTDNNAPPSIMPMPNTASIKLAL